MSITIGPQGQNCKSWKDKMRIPIFIKVIPNHNLKKDYIKTPIFIKKGPEFQCNSKTGISVGKRI